MPNLFEIVEKIVFFLGRKNCFFVKWVGLNFLWYAKSLGGGEYLVEKV